MILRFAAVFALACLAAPAFAQEQAAERPEACDDTDKPLATRGIDDPVIAVRALYQDGMEIPGRDLPLTDRLHDLMQREDLRRDYHDVPLTSLDFDWVVNGQDALIGNIEVKGREVGLRLPDEPERMVVTAKFTNFDTPNYLEYYWEKGPNGWRLDDVSSLGEGLTWTLSLLLAFGN